MVLMAFSQVDAHEFESKSPLGVSVVQKGSVVKLFYRGEQTGKVKVTIFNAKGNVVFREVMQDTEHFMRPYNFSSLPYGDYTIELSDASGKRYQKVTHKRVSDRIAHLTRLGKGENKYMLAVPSRGKDVITVRIYDASDRMLLEEVQTIDGNFAKVYNLSAVGSLSTFVVVNGEGKINRLYTR